MKMIIILVLVIFSTSCKTDKICKQIKRNKINDLAICGISFQFDRCLCHCFNLTNFERSKLSSCDEFKEDQELDSIYATLYADKKGRKFYKFPINKCEGISGFLNGKWALEVRPKIKSLKILREDICGE